MLSKTYKILKAIMASDIKRLEKLCPKVDLNVPYYKSSTNVTYNSVSLTIEKYFLEFAIDYPETIDVLCKHGADLNIIVDDETYLHIAVNHRNLLSVKKLVAHRANLNVKIGNGVTPLTLSDDCEIINYLLDIGADYKIIDNDGRTFLARFAAKYTRSAGNSIKTLQRIIDLCPDDINRPDDLGSTPLRLLLNTTDIFSLNNLPDIRPYELLLKSRATIDNRVYIYKQPFTLFQLPIVGLSMYLGLYDITILLLRCGAKPINDISQIPEYINYRLSNEISDRNRKACEELVKSWPQIPSLRTLCLRSVYINNICVLGIPQMILIWPDEIPV